jgi:hypothetical protein
MIISKKPKTGEETRRRGGGRRKKAPSMSMSPIGGDD